MSTIKHRIDTIAALEAVIGKTPGPVMLKVIDHLDDTARHWIASSPFVFAAFGDAGGIVMRCGGGPRGFAQVPEPTRLRLPLAALDEAMPASVGQGFGALFLSPGIGETLRVNGRVIGVDGEGIEIGVEECYVHCAKALIRSGFWSAQAVGETPAASDDFLLASRFMALASIDAQGRADVSPKGDPAGTMIRPQGEALWYADRPGNRRVDSFRNILMQPHIAATVLIPGSTRIALLRGRATITSDAAMRAQFTVDGRQPLLATQVQLDSLLLCESAALARAQLWPVGERDGQIDPAAMFVAHVKLSKTRGLQASLARAALSVPGLMEKGLRHDYKNKLY